MTEIILPNVRKLLVPDPGYTMFDADLKGADAQVVAWEAEDEDLKAAFRAGVDIHVKNAEDLWGAEFTKLQGYAREKKRDENKISVHLTNYGGTARAIAMVHGWTIHEADKFQKRWFSLHPGIKTKFQKRVEESITRTKTITNIYGWRRIYFGRPHECYTEALAWKPQSTVAITTYIGGIQLIERFSQVELLIQDHDNWLFQIPNDKIPPVADIRKALSVTTPYDDPLTIPWELSCSTKSWGDCEKIGG